MCYVAHKSRLFAFVIIGPDVNMNKPVNERKNRLNRRQIQN